MNRFVDLVKIEVRSGKGGDGNVSFAQKKYAKLGKPVGGNGGDGGDIVFQTTNDMTTLLDFTFSKLFIAGNGHHGDEHYKDGKSGEDVIIRVPKGTLIYNDETDYLLHDFGEEGVSYTVAKGGLGGNGNAFFSSSKDNMPNYATKGAQGETLKLRLELKLIADIGLVGFPNAGKSTFIRTVSNSKAKVASYPFTTLHPNLGVVKYRHYKSFVIADIPGIIENAHLGEGLGLQFLRHIERTKMILFLIDISDLATLNIISDYEVLKKELNEYKNNILVNVKSFIVFTKSDLDFNQEKLLSAKKCLDKQGIRYFTVSSHARLGVNELVEVLCRELGSYK